MVLFSRVSRLGRELLLLWRHSDICSSLMKCVSPTREHISLGICVRGNTCHGQESVSCHGETHINVTSQWYVFPGTLIPSELCFPYSGTHITRDMCFPGRETHITRDMRSGEHISRRNTYHCDVTTDMCFPYPGTHVTSNMCFSGRETHIISMFFPVICVPPSTYP